jgi:hypothetical protein
MINAASREKRTPRGIAVDANPDYTTPSEYLDTIVVGVGSVHMSIDGESPVGVFIFS